MSLNYSAPEFNYAGFEQARTRFDELALEASQERCSRGAADGTARHFFALLADALSTRRRR